MWQGPTYPGFLRFLINSFICLTQILYNVHCDSLPMLFPNDTSPSQITTWQSLTSHLRWPALYFTETCNQERNGGNAVRQLEKVVLSDSDYNRGSCQKTWVVRGTAINSVRWKKLHFSTMMAYGLMLVFGAHWSEWFMAVYFLPRQMSVRLMINARVILLWILHPWTMYWSVLYNCDSAHDTPNIIRGTCLKCPVDENGSIYFDMRLIGSFMWCFCKGKVLINYVITALLMLRLMILYKWNLSTFKA